MSKFSESILVTGDVVKDIAIYKGDRITPSDSGRVRPHFSQELGGAMHLFKIIAAAVGLERARFAFAPLSHQEFSEFPDELTVHTLWKLQEGGLKKEHSETGKKDKPLKVWRVSEALGYAPAPKGKPEPTPFKKVAGDSAPPVVLVMDDAGLGFRSMRSKDQLWPDGIENKGMKQPRWIVAKMSHPVAQGDLWRELIFQKGSGAQKQPNNLVVITSAKELRATGMAISRGFSWERTLSELNSELVNNTAFLPLIMCSRFLIINLGCNAAVVFENQGSQTADEIVDAGKLIYDPTMAEGQWKHIMQDSTCPVYGVMNTFSAAVAVHLLAFHRDEGAALGTGSRPTLDITEGIQRGLTGVRILRLLGHGTEHKTPQFPYDQVALVIRPPAWFMDSADLKKQNLAPSPVVFSGNAMANPPVTADAEREWAEREARCLTHRVAEHGYEVIQKPVHYRLDPKAWTLVSLAETPFSLEQPLIGLAHCHALYGDQAILHIPHARFGDLLSVDRSEIETLRSLRQMIEAFGNNQNAKRPLCLAAFGPPGAGKSYGIKQIAHEVLGRNGKKAEILEFNLSQYDDPAALIGAFHQVRDKVLQGHLPVVFWDEFDSQGYKWLQFLLSPMQDGAFQSDQLTHPIGKCIFVFAGATSWDFEHFGPVPLPQQGSADWETRQELYKKHPAVKKEDLSLEADFRLKKGPDFISRLDGYINVLGPNPRMLYDYTNRGWTRTDATDLTWPVRRAMLLRSFLGARKNDLLEIDRDLLRAFLLVPRYVNGARSMEKIAVPLATAPKPFRRVNLPPPQVLDQHLDTSECFNSICTGNQLFREPGKLWLVAAAINEYYARLTSEQENKKRRELSVRQFVNALARSDTWSQATNLAAAARIPEVLAIAGLQMEEGHYANTGERKTIENHILHPHHLHNMAREEHNLWMNFHRENNWGYVDPEAVAHLTEADRKKEIKRLKKEERLHTLLIPFDELPPEEQEKDYFTIRHYQDIADLIGYKIGFMRVS